MEWKQKLPKISFFILMIGTLSIGSFLIPSAYGEVTVESGATFVANQTVIMNEESGETDPVNILLAVAGLSGVAGLFWGIYQYRESRNDKRKETFFQLTKDFDSSMEILPAKKILDEWAYHYTKKKGLFISNYGGFHIDTIKWILAPSYDERVEVKKEFKEELDGYSEADLDEAWRLLRDSFDALFDFFERLVYLKRNGRITKDELGYFIGFMRIAKNDEDIVKFLDEWEYGWHKEV